MSKKLIAVVVLGIAAMLLGMLWFLQGAGIVYLRPILCVADCEVITEKSLQWQAIGVVTFVVGAIIVGACARRASGQSKK